jgi:uracil-DNA glycosylase
MDLSKKQNEGVELYEKFLCGVPTEWKEIFDLMEIKDIATTLAGEKITPPPHLVFEFARLTPLSSVKIVILGQDPYPTPGDAHGLAFSTLATKTPGSLKNIFAALKTSKLIQNTPPNNDLSYLAVQGVLFLNTALTTIEGKIGSHINIWAEFTANLIYKLSSTITPPPIFILWGKKAQEFDDYINPPSHVLKYHHPSPATAKPFKDCPNFLEAEKIISSAQLTPIIWDSAEFEANWAITISFEEAKSTLKSSTLSNPILDKFGIKDEEDQSSTIIAFVDGSCAPNKSCPESRGGYAVNIALGPIPDMNIYGSLDNSKYYSTNQRAEGYAILSLLHYLSYENSIQFKSIIVVSDSEFWIKTIKYYTKKWKNIDEHKNPDIVWGICRLLYRMKLLRKKVDFIHMQSHDNKGWGQMPQGTYERYCFEVNNFVDSLAKYARTLPPGTQLIEYNS